MTTAPHVSLLHGDLTSLSHDASYRAMSFIARRHGPQIDGPPDDPATLAAQRDGMLAWLQARSDQAALEHDYAQFRQHWSPIFKDA